MRLRITHETILSYEPAVTHGIYVLRQIPATDSAQFVRDWHIDVNLDCWVDRVTDAFGNTLATFSLKGPLDAVRIIASGEVDVDDTHGVYAGGGKLPLELFLRPTALTEPTPEVAAFVVGIAAEHGGALQRGHALNALIADTLKPGYGTEGAPPAGEAIRSEKPNAVGAAHLFVAAARLIGLPSRVTSGYLFAPGEENATGLHVWAESHIDGLGWVGFDPVAGRCPTDHYVRLATGTDSLGVVPLRDGNDGFGARTIKTEVRLKEAQPPRAARAQKKLASVAQTQGG